MLPVLLQACARALGGRFGTRFGNFGTSFCLKAHGTKLFVSERVLYSTAEHQSLFAAPGRPLGVEGLDVWGPRGS